MVSRKPGKNASKGEDERSLEETECIREKTLKKLLSTPPKTHDEMVKGRKAKPSDKKGSRSDK